MCTALVVGGMIGSGVFLLPSALAPYGWNALLGWGVTIPGAVCLAFVFARLARAFPQAGGPYAYTREAFGHGPAFIVAWSYWIAVIVANGVIAIACVSYLGRFFPALAATAGLPAGIAVALIWVLTAVNCRSVALAGSVQIATTAIKLVPLVAVAVIGAVAVARHGTAIVLPFHTTTLSISAVTASATLTLWALVGFEAATLPAAKVIDPGRTIPRATLVGVSVTGLVYIVCCSAITLLLPPDVASSSHAPFADFAARFVGEQAGRAIAIFAAIAAFGALNGWILVQGELPLALAGDGVFPRWFGLTTARGVPVRAHLLGSALVTLLVISNYTRSLSDLFVFMALLSTAATLVTYLACSLATLKLRRDPRLAASPELTVLASIGVLFSLWTLYGAGREAVVWGAALLASGIPVYALMRRSRRPT